MADDANLQQYNSIYTLQIKPGIKRDGTVFEAEEFTDGVWCRFQRERARKMGGYKTVFNSLAGIYRGMVIQPYNGVNYIFAGNYNELDVFTTDTNYAVGTGPYPATILPGQVELQVVNPTTNTIDIAGTSGTSGAVKYFPVGTEIIFSQSGTPTTYTTTSVAYNAPYVRLGFSGTIPASPTQAWIANEPVFTPDPAGGPYRLDWQFDAVFSPAGGQLQILAHPGYNLVNIDNGVPSQVLVGNITPGADFTWTFSGLSDSAGPAPTYAPISVDGGVCMLYPFTFVYGSHGYIANNNVSTQTNAADYNKQSLYDWNGPFANQVNVSASKVVKGMTVRGGTNSPSGLFWSTDSLIRVSFTVANAPIYWNYDIVTSQISVMSSAGIVEMDGIYFWMGVDRFYLYNGSVKVLPNDKNVNYLFDNINFSQRQKVWATKIPRFNEIWFFYPRGQNEECTDAIIYNTKDQIWYDAGQADGARRSCGYTTELLPTPIWVGWDFEPIYTAPARVIATPSGLSAPAANQFYVSGDLTPTFSPGDFVTTGRDTTLPYYTVTESTNIINTSGAPAPGVTLITVNSNFSPALTVGQDIFNIYGGYNFWQHEFGNDKVSLTGSSAIYSSITTSDISWIGGTPSGDNAQGVNRRMHLRRFEPNFLQTGVMELNVLGRKFADDDVDSQVSGPYYFSDLTGKIDLRVEYRLMRLKFVSNDLGGSFEMGRNIITCEYGDERP
jgi:hypothetical protein